MLKYFLIAVALCSTAMGQITIFPQSPEAYDIIVAKVNLGDQIPEGAKVRGSWSVQDCKWTKCGEDAHISAKPGKHLICASGVWVLTRDVEIGDETVPILIDFGQYNYNMEVLVGEDPDPPPPPPPPPNDEYQLVMFYDGNQLDNYPQNQRMLLTSRELRNRIQSKGHQFLQVVEKSGITTNPSGPLAEFIASVVGDALPRLAIRPVSGGPVQDFPLPAGEGELMALLEDPSQPGPIRIPKKLKLPPPPQD